MKALRNTLCVALAAASLWARADDAQPTLTLGDAIRLSLQRNRVLRVASFDKGISRANLLAARGQFEPSVVLSRSFSETQFTNTLGPIPVPDSTKTDSYSAGIQGLLPLGTQYSLSASTIEVRDVYNGVSKNFQSFGGFQVTQPLLKGFGFGANLANVRIAKANRDISDYSYRQSAIDTVTNVVIAYSNLLLAHDELDAAEKARAQARALLDDNEKAFHVGSVSESDVITSRAYAAQYEESILIAGRAVRDAQNQLRNLIGEDSFLEDEPLFVLAPMEIPYVAVDRRADLARALAGRPDYQQQRLLISKNRILESSATNGLLPQVDLVGGYGYNGNASTFSASRQMVQDHLNPSVAAGVTVTIPIAFASARGSYRSARLQRMQAEEDLKRLEADVAVSVANADGQIETARQRVEKDRVAYEFAKQALAAEEKKKKAGSSSTLAVAQQQGFVVAMESAISQALAAERQAVAAYDQALGATLERYNVRLGD